MHLSAVQRMFVTIPSPVYACQIDGTCFLLHSTPWQLVRQSAHQVFIAMLHVAVVDTLQMQI